MGKFWFWRVGVTLGPNPLTFGDQLWPEAREGRGGEGAVASAH